MRRCQKVCSFFSFLALVVPASSIGFKFSAYFRGDLAFSTERSTFLSKIDGDGVPSAMKASYEYGSWLANDGMPIRLLRWEPTPGGTNIQGSGTLKVVGTKLVLLAFGTPQQLTVDSAALPIVGGLLTRAANTENLQELGVLIFTFRLLPNKSSMFCDGSPAVTPRVRELEVVTELARYRSALVGSVDECGAHRVLIPFRKAIYRATQVNLHKYIMWRFHRKVGSGFQTPPNYLN